MEVAGKIGDLVIIEAMKNKYKLEKKKRGYTVSNIKDKGGACSHPTSGQEGDEKMSWSRGTGAGCCVGKTMCGGGPIQLGRIPLQRIPNQLQGISRVGQDLPLRMVALVYFIGDRGTA